MPVHTRTCSHCCSLPLIALGAIVLASCQTAPPDGETADGAATKHASVPASGFFECDGLQIHYESFGAGPPIVLVPGWGANTETNWVGPGWIDALKGSRMVVSLEPRGHGKSDKPHVPAAYSYAAMSRDVIALMEHLNIDRADYMGYSMGAFMGAYLLGHHTERFNAMILGGIGNETEESANACIAIAEALRAPDPSSITDPVGAGYRMYAASNPDNDLEVLAISALQMWPEGYPLELGGEGLRRARIPVLIVNGSDDHPYVDSDDLLAEAIPNAQLVTLPGANHLSAVTHPEFKQAVLKFLAQP